MKHNYKLLTGSDRSYYCVRCGLIKFRIGGHYVYFVDKKSKSDVSNTIEPTCDKVKNDSRN
jgi:hypothetical protein